MLNGKNIVVGVCGGIAAYKVVDMVSRLRKLNAKIEVIMTKNACEFVTPLTFRSLSDNPVITDMWEEPKQWDIQHISIANKADLFVVAPATANVIGKIANGIADDMLTTTIMATKAPVLFVPAMNTNMYENAIVQQNISKLKSLGYRFMEPEVGTMAERGVSGKGRLPEPPQIVDQITEMFRGSSDLKGKKLLVTAGPTCEDIDPVRYITNHSSGKMGYAIAKAAARRGAEVTLVSGPVSIVPPDGVNIIKVKTAIQMRDAVMADFGRQDAFLMVAAVADYRVLNTSTQKIKKKGDTLEISLVKNPDIAEELGKIKGEKKLVGFCAETENVIGNAKDKILRKNMDFIVANDVTMEGAGFGTDTNIVKIIGREGIIEDLPKISKDEVADKILDNLRKLLFMEA